MPTTAVRPHPTRVPPRLMSWPRAAHLVGLADLFKCVLCAGLLVYVLQWRTEKGQVWARCTTHPATGAPCTHGVEFASLLPVGLLDGLGVGITRHSEQIVVVACCSDHNKDATSSSGSRLLVPLCGNGLLRAAASGPEAMGMTAAERHMCLHSSWGHRKGGPQLWVGRSFKATRNAVHTQSVRTSSRRPGAQVRPKVR